MCFIVVIFLFLSLCLPGIDNHSAISENQTPLMEGSLQYLDKFLHFSRCVLYIPYLKCLSLETCQNLNLFGFWNICTYTVIYQGSKEGVEGIIMFHIHLRHRACGWGHTVFECTCILTAACHMRSPVELEYLQHYVSTENVLNRRTFSVGDFWRLDAQLGTNVCSVWPQRRKKERSRKLTVTL